MACDEEFEVTNPINKHFVSKGRDEVLGTRPDKPAESCVDIIFNGSKHNKDGLYYITKGDRVHKVWCDMTIDHGGWNLFYAYGHHKYEHYVVNQTSDVFPRHPEYGRSHVNLAEMGLETRDIAELRFECTNEKNK